MANATARHGRTVGSVVRAMLRRRHRSVDDDLRYLSPAEVASLIEATARKELGMSATEFYAAVERGELQDDPAAAHLVLISGARPR